MKRFALIFCFLVLVGCSYQGEKLSSYLDEPRTIIQDPHFKNYKKSLDSVESQYLKKEITYAQYLEQKRKIDEKYEQEVQERNSKIQSSN